MIKRYQSKLFMHVVSNKIKYLLSTLCLLTGIIIGVTNAIGSADTNVSYIDKFYSSYIVGGVSESNVFWTSILFNLRTFVIIWLSGWLIWLTPLNYLEVGAKGYSIGYTYAFLILSEHLRGLTFSILTQFVQTIIIIPSIIIYSVTQLNFAINFDKVYKSQVHYKERKKLIIGNIILLLASFLPIIICGYIEGFIVPFLIKFLA